MSGYVFIVYILDTLTPRISHAGPKRVELERFVTATLSLADIINPATRTDR